jgi:hypothetical protein
MDSRKERETELTKFVEQVRADDSLQKRIGEAGTPEQTADGIAEIAREEGHSFSRDEILAELRKTADQADTLKGNGTGSIPNTTMGNP